MRSVVDRNVVMGYVPVIINNVWGHLRLHGVVSVVIIAKCHFRTI